jgi:hypothetical protein
MLTSYSRSKLTLTTEHQVGNPQRTPPQLKQAIALDWEGAICFLFTRKHHHEETNFPNVLPRRFVLPLVVTV